MVVEVEQVERRYEGLRVIDRGRVARLAASIAEVGQRTPALVTRSGVLVDGYHRLHALRRMGVDVMEAVELSVDGAEALVLAWQLETGRRRSALEDAWLLRELVESQGWKQSELATRLRRSKAWVSGRLGLVRALPEDVQEAVRSGRIPAQAATASLVPMCRASAEAASRMVAAVTEALSAREVERLWRGWRSSDAEGRGRIEQQPHLFLRAEEAVMPVAADEVSQLIGRLHGLAGLCRHVHKAVEAGVFTRVNAEVVEAWTGAESAIRGLKLAVLRVESGDA